MVSVGISALNGETTPLNFAFLAKLAVCNSKRSDVRQAVEFRILINKLSSSLLFLFALSLLSLRQRCIHRHKWQDKLAAQITPESHSG